jgi:predicted unusual protein kinase regulating ubiquinone biosynthesis (AarF/ABC1/UbiB family)
MTATTSPLPTASYERLPYDPEAIAKQYRGQFFKVVQRILTWILPFLNLLIWINWDKLWGHDEANRKQYAIRLRDILTDLGPTSIKIGQALSTRPDLVSPVFLEELTKLQDELPAFDNEIAFAIIHEELGHPANVIYENMSPKPIAAASLGQVYQAYLKTGEKVAIKVQRPNLLEKISLDMYILRSLAIWAKHRFSRIRSDLVGIIDEFASKLYEEMDYMMEGQNAERFVKLYQRQEIYVPKIYWSYTNHRVLTMEWIDGIKLTQLKKIADAGLDGRKLIEVGVNCSLRQLLENGFFHADPHPGNLLAMADGRLAYIDFGMMSTVQPKQRYGLLKAIVHLVNRDFSGLAQDYVELGFLTEDTNLTPIIPAFAQVFAEAMGASVAELNFKSITDKLSSVMYDYPFRVPAYYALIIRSLVTLEGIAIGLDRNFKVLSVAYPYVASRLLSDPAPELRVSLREELLFSQGEFRWNRLENLLRNASSTPEFNLEETLDKALDFIFSERGSFIRENLITALFSSDQKRSDNLQHLDRLWHLLSQSPSFQPLDLLPLAAKVIAKPEAQQLGQQLASRWIQKEVSHFLRSLFDPGEVYVHKG